MKTYCTHDDCRLGVATDLGMMYEELRRPDLLDAAIGVLIRPDAEVVCRRVPPTPRPSLDGRVTAPLPPRRGP